MSGALLFCSRPVSTTSSSSSSSSSSSFPFLLFLFSLLLFSFSFSFSYSSLLKLIKARRSLEVVATEYIPEFKEFLPGVPVLLVGTKIDFRGNIPSLSLPLLLYPPSLYVIDTHAPLILLFYYSPTLLTTFL